MVARAFERDSLLSLIAGPLAWSAPLLTLYVLTALAVALIATIWQTLPVFFFAACR